MERVPVEFNLSSGEVGMGQALITRWSSREAFWRGFIRALKIVAILIGITLPLLFLEPFLFLIWGTVVIGMNLMFVGPYLHLKYWNERISFSLVEATCPHCQNSKTLKPYLSTEFKPNFVGLCPSCGQTVTFRSTR